MKKQKFHAYLVGGLAYGDEGKGATVDFLVRQRQAGLVVRYNGGAQAAHNVVTPDGRHHTFSQFGSGMFVPGVKTFLSRFMLVNPMNMITEAMALKKVGVTDALARTFVEDEAVVMTPFQRAINRLEELGRGKNRHGSCGMGIGHTKQDYLRYGKKVLFMGDLKSEQLTREKLMFLQKVNREKLDTIPNIEDLSEEFRYLDYFETLNDYRAVDHWWTVLSTNCKAIQVVKRGFLDDLMEENRVVVFEGAQGILLDQLYGEEDHNTWTDCTFNNALTLLYDPWWTGEITKIGVLRPYMTRHGDGPFRTENKTLKFEEPHNLTGTFQGPMRYGYLDIPYLKYGMMALMRDHTGIIALNHLDQMKSADKIVEYVQEHFGLQVGIVGYGPTADNKFWRRDDRQRDGAKDDGGTQLLSNRRVAG